MKLIVFSCLVAAATAHICLFSPPQRGSMNDVNKPEAADCFLTKGPCGGRSLTQQLAVVQGTNFTVNFQKNLDHFNSAAPGYFSIMFGMIAMGGKKVELMRIPDMGKPSLTLYSYNVTIPMGFTQGNQLQVIYAPNNAQAPPAFYQCGDIFVLG